MFLLLPDFSSVAWNSSDSLWDVMNFCLAWPTQKASVLSCGTPGPGLWLPSWQIQMTKSSESPQFRWQNRGRAQTGSVPTGHGWGPNLCPQLLYISTPGLELCCTLTVFKENCWIRWFTALPIRWACHPPHTSATCPPLGYTLPTRGAAECVSSALVCGRGAFSCFVSPHTWLVLGVTELGGLVIGRGHCPFYASPTKEGTVRLGVLT